MAVDALPILLSIDPGELLTAWGFSLSSLFGQQDGNAGPLALLTLHRDGTEMGLDNALDKGKKGGGSVYLQYLSFLN